MVRARGDGSQSYVQLHLLDKRARISHCWF